MVSVIDHLLGHAAVDADILTRDKPCHVRAKIEYHIGNVKRIPHSARRLLRSIGSIVNGVLVVYPTGRDRNLAHRSLHNLW